MSALFEPLILHKGLTVRNRVAMASMTRNRCVDACKPGPAQIKFYADRARDGPGIIVSEGVLVDWAGMEWKHVPVMITNEHALAWRAVVDAVHKEGALMFFQAWHPGIWLLKTLRVPGHTDKVKAIDNPKDVIETYRRAAALAKLAGFDGIEFLCQGGYLPQQFLNSRANKRTDQYGGSVENRCRFVLEVVDVISKEFGGPEFICVKISPTDVLYDSVVTFDEMKETYTYLISELVKREVGIINICRRGADITPLYPDILSRLPRPDGYPLPSKYDPVLDFGPLVKCLGSATALMANQDYNIESGNQLVQDGKVDLLMIGRPFIYNPDLVSRIKRGVAFATNDRGDAVNYGPYSVPDENYNDWPAAAV